MEDKILKYVEFIKEEVENRSAILMRGKLTKIKNALEKLISDSVEEENDDIETISVRNAKDKANKDLTLKDFGVKQESSELLKNKSSIVDSLTFKFSDSDSAYTLYIATSIKDSVAANNENDVKKFEVNLKKYNLATTEYYGDVNKNNVEINIDEDNNLKISIQSEKEGEEPTESDKNIGMSLEDFLLDIKLEIDKTYGGEEEDLQIETE